jgi:phospholipid/cholesterol/gamma-HCH transport system substrate-binding protein
MTGSLSTRSRYRLYGLAFLLVAVLAGAMLVAVYNKAFTPFVAVTLRSDRAGLQLLPTSDVKIRGLIVGAVRDIRTTDQGAAIDLAIEPDKAAAIPRNVSARILPKTIFGEKYVELQLPRDDAGTPAIRSGDQIPQDRSATAVEIDRILNGLMPLLRAIKPERLNATLNALAMALQGRGNQLGEQIEDVDALLKKVNPQLPLLLRDLKAVGDVAAVYDAAAPDLMRLLRNMMTTSSTIVEKGDTIDRVIDQGITVGDDSREFLAANENRLVGFGVANRGALAILARYSPSLPCVIEGLNKARPDLEDAVGGRQPGVKVTLELVKPRAAYKPGVDTPRNDDHRGPRCYGLPDPERPFPNHEVLDGTEDSKWWAGSTTPEILVDPSARTVAEDNDLVKGLMAPMLETPADEVPDIATLLVGPVAHGSVVTIG